ncbi:MAG: T9SS C-terminal target domain-containing protein, partial [Calditrichaeota bacterium]
HGGAMRYLLHAGIGMLLSICLLFANPPQQRVLRVGGLELSPFGYGYMETQPHQPLDSTNTGFANYYARISLWISGITATGDTLVSTSDAGISGNANRFVPMEIYRDTTNVLNLRNVRFTTISLYQDTVAGWQVGQFNVALNDHSAGVLMYEIQYTGKHGTLTNVYAGVHFDFDVPDNQNHATPEDDLLNNLISGYRISDTNSNSGMDVSAVFSPLYKNYWQRDDSPATIRQLVELMTQNNPVSPQGAADYHFYIGSGPFTVQANQSVVLLYFLTPYGQGFNKSASGFPGSLQKGLQTFIQDKRLASIRETVLQKEDGEGDIPLTYQLSQNYPNPFNPSTEIRFQLPEAGEVRLYVYNTLGQKVATLINRFLEAGSYRASWNGRNTQGKPVSSGVYIYRISTPGFQAQKKMLLIR